MGRISILTAALILIVAAASWANGPTEAVIDSEQVLNELMAIPARQIPQTLLAEAQGIAIIPNVIKIGFIGGARRGHGVVLVRDADGEWSLPQFVALTGGSVGFQAGIQGSDVVLVFTTRKGVEGLMSGKFTVGVDAAASAGPVGRNAEIGTDATLRSEIYSYSRSRGLFLGVALDGSVLEIDHESHAAYYGTATGQVPARIPKPATDLRQYLTDLTPRSPSTPIGNITPAPNSSPRVIEGLRRSLVQNANALHARLSSEWRSYLALPKEVYETGTYPSAEIMQDTVKRYQVINTDKKYQDLAQHVEFQRTYETLIEYDKALSTTHPKLELPAPPR